MINAAQIRAARGLIGWSQDELAEQAGVSVSIVESLESEADSGHAAVERLERVERALEAGGAVFIDADGLGPGVRLLGA